jgi:Tfp pilus assembly protein PilO
MKITSMQKMIALGVGLLAIAALGVFLFVLPMNEQLGTLAADKARAQTDLVAAEAQLATLEDTKSRSASTEAEMLKIGTQMPDSPQLPTLIMEMQDIANAAGVKVTSFSPAQPAPSADGKYTEISLGTQFEARWTDVLDYLRRLDKSTRLLRVTNVTITALASADTTATADEEVNLSVSLTTKAYVIGNNGVVGAAPAAK